MFLIFEIVSQKMMGQKFKIINNQKSVKKHTRRLFCSPHTKRSKDILRKMLTKKLL